MKIAALFAMIVIIGLAVLACVALVQEFARTPNKLRKLHDWILAAPALALQRIFNAYNRLRYGAQPTFANTSNVGTHEDGLISYLTDAAIGTRYFVVKIGSDASHVAVSAANTDIPLGICRDTSRGAEEPVTVNVFGAHQGTEKAIAKAAINAGDFIQTNGDGKVIVLKATTGTWYIIGRALTAATADGDEIEFAPCFPIKVVVP